MAGTAKDLLHFFSLDEKIMSKFEGYCSKNNFDIKERHVCEKGHRHCTVWVPHEVDLIDTKYLYFVIFDRERMQRDCTQTTLPYGKTYNFFLLEVIDKEDHGGPRDYIFT